MSNKRGFTLIEVMLALALSSLVLMAVATAIDIHLRLLDSGRTQVEEAQLARAVLRRIADDLRSTIRHKSGETAEIVPDTGSLDGMSDGEPSEELENEDSMDDPAESDAPESVPGLYGNIVQLKIDTSRLPRIDQFDGQVSDGSEGLIVDHVSDIKTVTYYVNDEQSAQAANSLEPVPGGTGLVRREQDRATALWAAEGGMLDESESLQEPLAPEVAKIQFQYHDGVEWLEEWDSAEQEDLPKAVKITVWIIPVVLRNSEADEVSQDDLLTYTLTVHLPMAGEGGQ